MIELKTLTAETGTLTNKTELIELLVHMLENDIKINLNFAIEFDVEDLEHDNCNNWYGIKDLQIFDDWNGENNLLALGYWGGTETEVKQIDLEYEIFEQVESFVNRYFYVYQLNIYNKIALFLE